jgi:hypothetical protein
MDKKLHSPIGASSMYRWSACPGSVRLCKGIESVETEYAKQGRQAHEKAAHWLRTGHEPMLGFPSEEMREAVKEYVEYVKGLALDARYVFLVEQPFDLSKIHEGAFGTADAVVYEPDTQVLNVIDFKYGEGIFVPIENNLQAHYYALGALVNFNFVVERVRETIVQPRISCAAGTVRSLEYDLVDYHGFMQDLRTAIAKTGDPAAPLVPGDWCRFCPAAPTCPALLATAQAVAKTEFKTGVSYDPVKLKEALDKRPIVQAWLKALDEFAYAEAEAGRTPLGYKLVDKRATRKWLREADVIAAFQDLFGQKIYEEPTLRSPAQMEKVIGKDAIKPYVISESSGRVLVPESDKREAAKISSPQEDFKNV